jgi:ABC-type lipoprotein release transport system permease subunit
MSFLRLLLRNLLYHWRGNLAVLLGVALGTAVLTGALLVGDSLRGSLRELTLDRLGWIDQAMVPGRLFRAKLADELPADRRSVALMLSGSASTGVNAKARRVGGVTVLGVDSQFWSHSSTSRDRQGADSPVPAGSAFWESSAAEVALNQTLADLLDVREGDAITLNVQKTDEVPRESLLGKRKTSDVLAALEVKVRQVLPDTGLARFSLKPTPEAARNVFVPLRFLQSELDVANKVNALLVADASPRLADTLRAKLTLDDWGLRLRTPQDRAIALVNYLAPNDQEGRLRPARWRGRVPPELAKAAEANKGILTREQVVTFYEKQRPYVSLESRQIFLPQSVVDSADTITAGSGRHMFVYLADSIESGAKKHSYVVLGAVRMGDGKPWAALGVPPPSAMPTVDTGQAGDIVLVDTPESPWQFKPGDSIDVTYVMHDIVRKHAPFKVKAVVPMRGELDDPDLTPEFPGITDQPDMRSWRPTFPYDAKRVTAADEAYWQRYRATPRAYVSLEAAQRLWGERFGSLTAVQFFDVIASTLEKELLARLPPERGGFVFQPVRANAEPASSGSTDFGMYFLAFSFFLIVSALVLVGLLVRLNLDRRASQIGLLLATGWSHHRVRRLLLGEGALLAIVGGCVGLAGALAYGRLMLDLLRASWPGGDSLNFLRLHVEPASLVYGYVGSLTVSILTVYWATRALARLSPRSLLAGATSSEGLSAARRRWPLTEMLTVLATVGAGSLMIAGFFVKGNEAKAGSFFGSGALVLIAGLAAIRLWLGYTGRHAAPRPSLTALGVRNAGRHAVRSLLTVGLLATATFLIVAVECFHKDTGADFMARTGGSGGFTLIAETDIPIFEDLNRPLMRKEYGLTQHGLDRVNFYFCRVHGGDDTSCLNLYQPLQPRVLGVPPHAFDGRFHFAAMEPRPQEPMSEWSVLYHSFPDGAVPAVVDATSAEYVLHKKLGDTIEITNDRGEKVPLRIVGLLEDSIFQSEILVSEAAFRKLFPRQAGFAFFLIDCPDGSAEQVRNVQAAVETGLADQGVRVQTAASRLQAYLAVENMYLATFQALGGLGLCLGAIGLAIILMRGVWERRGELALLRALGFGSARLGWLVLVENLTLLLLGLATGTLAALLAVAPHLAGAGAHVLWLRISLLLVLVLATGLIAGGLAVYTTLRAPLLPALRRE